MWQLIKQVKEPKTKISLHFKYKLLHLNLVQNCLRPLGSNQSKTSFFWTYFQFNIIQFSLITLCISVSLIQFSFFEFKKTGPKSIKHTKWVVMLMHTLLDRTGWKSVHFNQHVQKVPFLLHVTKIRTLIGSSNSHNIDPAAAEYIYIAWTLTLLGYGTDYDWLNFVFDLWVLLNLTMIQHPQWNATITYIFCRKYLPKYA